MRTFHPSREIRSEDGLDNPGIDGAKVVLPQHTEIVRRPKLVELLRQVVACMACQRSAREIGMRLLTEVSMEERVVDEPHDVPVRDHLAVPARRQRRTEAGGLAREPPVPQLRAADVVRRDRRGGCEGEEPRWNMDLGCLAEGEENEDGDGCGSE